MFEVLIREAAARFGLGDKAPALIQLLLACMTSKETGGLTGFLEKFKAAGLGPIIQSWLGGGPAAQPISNSQLESVLGASGGPLPLLTERLDLPRDNITSALGYLLPTLVGKLTPGGNTPSSLPPEILSLAAAGQALLAAPGDDEDAGSRGGLGKWLLWVIGVVVLIALIYFIKNRADEAAPPAATPPAASAPATTSPSAASEPAPPAQPPASGAAGTTSVSPGPAQPASASSPAPASAASEPASEAASAPALVAPPVQEPSPVPPAVRPSESASEPASAAASAAG